VDFALPFYAATLSLVRNRSNLFQQFKMPSAQLHLPFVFSLIVYSLSDDARLLGRICPDADMHISAARARISGALC
jgi:hypothetical protein